MWSCDSGTVTITPVDQTCQRCGGVHVVYLGLRDIFDSLGILVRCENCGNQWFRRRISTTITDGGPRCE